MPHRLHRTVAAALAVAVLAGCSRDPGFVDLDGLAPPVAGDGYTPPPAPVAIAPDPETVASRVAYLDGYCAGVAAARAELNPRETVPSIDRARMALAAPAPAGLGLEVDAIAATVSRYEDTQAQGGGQARLDELAGELDEHLAALLRPLSPHWTDAPACRQLSQADVGDQAAQLSRALSAHASASSARADDPVWLAGAVATLSGDLPDRYRATVAGASVEVVDTTTGQAACVTPRHRESGQVTPGRCGG